MQEALIPVPDDWPKSRLETERITVGRPKLPNGGSTPVIGAGSGSLLKAQLGHCKGLD